MSDPHNTNIRKGGLTSVSNLQRTLRTGARLSIDQAFHRISVVSGGQHAAQTLAIMDQADWRYLARASGVNAQ